MHQIQKDKFHVISPEAFSPKPLNEVQKRLQAILDYWGPNGERHYQGSPKVTYEGCRACAIGAAYRVLEEYGPGDEVDVLMKRAAKEAGFPDISGCSASSFENARKMVLRAIALAGEP